MVTNSDGQSGSLSNGYTYTAGTGGGTIKFVQVMAATPQTPSMSVAVTYPGVQTGGNLNVVVVGWDDTTSSVSAVTDSGGNAYVLAVGPVTGSGGRESIYYAKNIAGGSNTVTVTFDHAAVYVDVRVLEYSGLDTVNPLDAGDGAGGGDRDECQQRSGDGGLGERIAGGGGEDIRALHGGGDGLQFADHHQSGWGHCGGQDRQQRGQLQRHGGGDFFQLGHADGGLPGQRARSHQSGADGERDHAGQRCDERVGRR